MFIGKWLWDDLDVLPSCSYKVRCVLCVTFADSGLSPKLMVNTVQSMQQGIACGMYREIILRIRIAWEGMGTGFYDCIM